MKAIAAGLCFAISLPLFAQSAVKYHTTIKNVKYVYATVEPVLRLKSGDILETNTLDAFGNAIQKPTDTLDMVKGDNPLSGPFYIEGAAPGDMGMNLKERSAKKGPRAV